MVLIQLFTFSGYGLFWTQLWQSRYVNLVEFALYSLLLFQLKVFSIIGTDPIINASFFRTLSIKAFPTLGFCKLMISILSERDLCTFRLLTVDWKIYHTYHIFRVKNFGIELSSQEVPPQVLSSIYNVSQLSSRWISVVPLSTLKTPKQN